MGHGTLGIGSVGGWGRNLSPHTPHTPSSPSSPSSPLLPTPHSPFPFTSQLALYRHL
ncbi:hypothetical protein H1Q63_14655 [Desmonostoc muscorum CCALA 125]|nr:hypothetical protein [Desmonostoc muscorum CCALA 125]